MVFYTIIFHFIFSFLVIVFFSIQREEPGIGTIYDHLHSYVMDSKKNCYFEWNTQEWIIFFEKIAPIITWKILNLSDSEKYEFNVVLVFEEYNLNEALHIIRYLHHLLQSYHKLNKFINFYFKPNISHYGNVIIIDENKFFSKKHLILDKKKFEIFKKEYKLDSFETVTQKKIIYFNDKIKIESNNVYKIALYLEKYSHQISILS